MSCPHFSLEINKIQFCLSFIIIHHSNSVRHFFLQNNHYTTRPPADRQLDRQGVKQWFLVAVEIVITLYFITIFSYYYETLNIFFILQSFHSLTLIFDALHIFLYNVISASFIFSLL